MSSSETMSEENVPTFELGDYIYIEGGRYNDTRGRIYYIDDELISILPEGAPDRLVNIPIVDGEVQEDLGIDGIYSISKRANPAFVAQIGAHTGQLADTFKRDGSLGLQYLIKEVNEEADTMTLVDSTGAETRIEFNFTGIPRDLDFIVLRPRQAPMPTNRGENVVEGVAEEEEEEDIFEDVEFEAPQEKEEEIMGLVERPVTERTYPDRIQRDEMFRNMLEALPLEKQKYPRIQKEIRQFVEQCLLLRNMVVKYSETGDPLEGIPTSFQTIAELLAKGDIPLARPVIQANKTLYLDKTDDDPTEIPGVALNIEYLSTNLQESNNFLESQLGGLAGAGFTGTEAQAPLPQWYYSWEVFFERFMRPWTSTGKSTTFQGDKEFLRAPIPNGIDPSADGLPKPKEALTSKELVTASLIGNVVMSLQKGLGPRAIRIKDKEPPRRVESGDEGLIVNQLLFPISTQRDLGTIRSGMIKKDIAMSHYTTRTLEDIFKQLNGVPEEATSGAIMSVGPGGNTLGNIAIEDWIRAQPLIIRGIGDALVELKNLGLTQRELTSDQQEILIEKIRQLRAIVRNDILEQHTAAEKARAELRLENAPFLQGEALEELLIVLNTEPQLQNKIEEIKAILPAYKDNDIGILSGLIREMFDLVITTIAAVPGPLALERVRRNRDVFLETLRKSTMKNIKEENAGEEPTPILCPHARSLEQIKKVQDNDDRMKLFAKFLARFQGKRENNWIICAASPRDNPHNLVCYHEVLLLQEFLHPREKDAIHKELLLAFSGGVFQGKYICKNCGQAISQMDFDQSIEFDDEGRPMSGRAVLVDKEEIQSEEFRLLLGAPAEEPEKADFKNDTQGLIYKTARDIFDVLGIYAEKATYSSIMERVESEVLRQPSREDYAKRQQARLKSEGGKPDAKMLDYDIYINRIIVCLVAVQSLIEIQTHIPDFIIRTKIPGCIAGFTGFPLGKEEDKTGINYISCAVASIKRNEAPWNMTGFLLQPNDKKRQAMIADLVMKMTTESVKSSTVQQLISMKLAFYEEKYEKVILTRGMVETVLPRFLPTPYNISMEDAAKYAVVPAAANNTELVRAWIQEAHKIAKENGRYVRGSPYSETSSCFVPIKEPTSFWEKKAATMPTLPVRIPPRGQSGSQIMLHMTPRRLARLSIEAPEDLYYRVFLRVCYDGSRKGYPHEPGYTHRCIHCGFTFPYDPYSETAAPPLLKDMYKEWKAEMDAIVTNGKTALETQRVIVNKSTFQDVLDATHKNFRVEIQKYQPPATDMKLFERFLRLEPEPFEGWRVLLSSTMERVARLTPNAETMAVAEAYGPMSDSMVRAIEELKRRIGDASVQGIANLFEQTPTQIVESVRTYFLVPFQRLLVDFHIDSLKVPSSYELPSDTLEDVHTVLHTHLVYLNTLKKYVKGYTALKLTQAKNALAKVLPMLQNEVRSTFIRGGKDGSVFFVGALVLGILLEFINPNQVPPDVSLDGGAYEPNARIPITILDVCINNFTAEGLNLSEEQIRDMISKRIEAEKMTFIKRLDKMTPEQKKVELMKKRLGLGEWAVGGTSAIFVLNSDQYEREKQQRDEMGVGEFVRDTAALQRAQDYLNEMNFGGGGAGAEGGYTVDQMGSDDY